MNRSSIWQAIELQLREDKKLEPNYPDHVCGQAGRVVEESGDLMTRANDVKYRKSSSEVLAKQQVEDLRKAAIRTAAAAIRFLMELK